MSARLLLKHTLKRTAGTAAVVASRVGFRPSEPVACILSYHRVAPIPLQVGPLDNWNVTPDRFAQHMRSLAQNCHCVPLLELPDRLARWRSNEPPLVSITFDDGFAGIATHAVPVLAHHRIPATVFLVTSCVGSDTPMPFDRWGRREYGRVPAAWWRTMTWTDVEHCLKSGLVTIGSHSHRHLDARRLDAAAVTEEAVTSRQLLLARLGAEHARAYAYPYGSARLGHVTQTYADAVQSAGYDTAVSTDLAMVTLGTPRHWLPRVEAHGLDSTAIIAAKVSGALLPYRVTDWLRRADRGVS